MFNSHFGVESHGESARYREAAGVEGAVRAVSGEWPDDREILRTRTCVGAYVLLLGKTCRIELGQAVHLSGRQSAAAESPVREARGHSRRDHQHRPGAFLLEFWGGGVGVLLKKADRASGL